MSAPTVQAPTFPLSPTELGKWSRFAIKGGIGHAVAKEDRIAEGMDQLMFIQGDELVVLIDLGKGEYVVSPALSPSPSSTPAVASRLEPAPRASAQKMLKQTTD